MSGKREKGLHKAWRIAALAAALLAQLGCAGLTGPDYGVYDASPELNRASFRLSEKVDHTLAAPAARAYQNILPDPLEAGVANFFANLRSVDSSINGFLQGKPKRGGTDLARFVMNSTIGVGGLFDVAARAGFQDQQEDLGQTLAVWGWRKSRYIYVPLVGPSTLRDLPSVALGAFAPRLLLGPHYEPWITGLGLLSARAEALVLTDTRDAAALDPYAFTREAYHQRREFLIYDGAPPLDDFDDFFDEPGL